MKGGHSYEWCNYYTTAGHQIVTDKKTGVTEIGNQSICSKKYVVFVSVTYQQIFENLFQKFAD